MKKIITLILTIAMMLSLAIPFAAMGASAADAQPSVWDGTVPAANKEYKFEGEGTKDSPYLIKSAAELAQFAANVRIEDVETCYFNTYFKLTCDIDMDNKPWMPIGGATPKPGYDYHKALTGQMEYTFFAGNFNGDGHKIYNMNLAEKATFVDVYDEDADKDSTETYEASLNKIGLFGYILGATIQNIGIESGNMNLTDVARVGALVGSARYGFLITNCYNKANLTVTARSNEQIMIGGLLGGSLDTANTNPFKVQKGMQTTSVIQNCWNWGDITVSYPHVAPVYANVGGIVGRYSGNASEIISCYNNNNITLHFPASWDGGDPNWGVGGIAGYMYEACYGEELYSRCNIILDGTKPGRWHLGILFGRISEWNVTGEGLYFSIPATSMINTPVSAACYKATPEQIANKEFPTWWANPVEIIANVTVPKFEGTEFMMDPATLEYVKVDDENSGSNGGSNNNGGGLIIPDAVETTAAATTAAATTKKADETTAKAEEKKGCGSLIGGSVVICAIALVGGATLLKKKED